VNENEIRFGKLLLDPSVNPAVLDTATWEPGLLEDETGMYIYLASGAKSESGSHYFLGQHNNGQYVIVCFHLVTGNIDYADVTTERMLGFLYARGAASDRGPRALGPIPRLGIGSRMTTAAWPGVYRAMQKGGFAANPIQNSMRELHLLDDLKEGTVPPDNYAPNVGTIVSGHTGSTWEGLWLYGVIEALKTEGGFDYGADADHIQVKRGVGDAFNPDSYDHARRIIDAARDYTFFTLDVSDLVNHGAHTIQDKYYLVLVVLQRLYDHIKTVKGKQPFDLEIAIDEVPAGRPACECITTDEDLQYIIRRILSWDIPLTHIAPNFGIEKEFDYRCPDGLKGLAERVKRQTAIAKDNGIMLDFHSGDDLSKETRQVIGEATDGYLHFKVSPHLQLLFAETLADYSQPEDADEGWLLHDWITDTVGDSTYIEWMAERERDYTITKSDLLRRPAFHNNAFAWVGQRDKQGRFVNRHRFYELSDEFYEAYRDRVVAYLLELQGDLGL